MHITDPVADMLTRIRNANNAKHETVDVPASNMKKSIAQILLDEGYIKAFQVVEDGTQGVIRITLKYNAGKEKVIPQTSRTARRTGRDPHHPEVSAARQGEGHLRPAPRVQARSAGLCGRRRAAPRSARPGHCHRIHF